MTRPVKVERTYRDCPIATAAVRGEIPGAKGHFTRVILPNPLLTDIRLESPLKATCFPERRSAAMLSEFWPSPILAGAGGNKEQGRRTYWTTPRSRSDRMKDANCRRLAKSSFPSGSGSKCMISFRIRRTV